MMFEEEINQTIRYIKPSGIRKFFDIAATRKGVISLGVGEPDFITPWHIREAAIHAIEKGRTFYTGNRGLLELRTGICNYYKRKFNVSYDPNENCIVTVGGSEAIDIVLRTLIKQGDEVILPTPAYVAYAAIIEMAGAKVVELELTEEDEFSSLVMNGNYDVIVADECLMPLAEDFAGKWIDAPFFALSGRR